MRPEIRPSIVARAEEVETSGKPINMDEWKELRMNSYEREYLLQFVSLETLSDIIDKTLDNCNRPSSYLVCTTYDEFAIHRLVPELARRLGVLTNLMKQVQSGT